MGIKVGIIELIPVYLAALFLAVMLVLQVLIRYFGIVTSLTFWADSNIMLPIYILFASAILSILLWMVRWNMK